MFAKSADGVFEFYFIDLQKTFITTRTEKISNLQKKAENLHTLFDTL